MKIQLTTKQFKTIRAKIHVNNKRAKDHGCNDLITANEWVASIEQHESCCAICGKVFDPWLLTIDHAMPLCYGGRNNKENIRPTCLACNNKKADKILPSVLSRFVLDEIFVRPMMRQFA